MDQTCVKCENFLPYWNRISWTSKLKKFQWNKKLFWSCLIKLLQGRSSIFLFYVFDFLSYVVDAEENISMEWQWNNINYFCFFTRKHFVRNSLKMNKSNKSLINNKTWLKYGSYKMSSTKTDSITHVWRLFLSYPVVFTRFNPIKSNSASINDSWWKNSLENWDFNWKLFFASPGPIQFETVFKSFSQLFTNPIKI